MAIRYSTNWMGPVSIDWYKSRGLVETVNITLDEDSFQVKHGYNKPGDVIKIDEITQHWAAGRIDIYGTGEPYPQEIGLPVMLAEDWNKFTGWLETFETDDVWTLEQLVEVYESSNPKIVWWNQDGVV